MTTGPEREKTWRALRPERLNVFLEAALKPRDAIGVEELTCGSPVQQSCHRTEIGLASLSRVSRADLLDSCSNPCSFGPVPEPGPGAELHSFLGTLNIRHKSLVDWYLHDFVAGNLEKRGSVINGWGL